MNFNRSWLEKKILRDEENRRLVRILDFREEFTVVGKGENFMGEVSRVRLRALTGAGLEAERSFVAKKVPDSEAMREFLKAYGVFDVEAQVYEEVLLGMEGLMRDSGDFRERPWCQLVGSIPGSAIVLEDLNALGYQKMHKYELLDEEHAVYVLKDLARFHAMGASLISQNTINPAKMKRLPIFEDNSETMYHRPALTAFRNAVQSTWGPGWSDLLGPLDHLTEHLSEFIKQLDDLGRRSLNVVSHGDCWTGNLMFKHDFRGEILSLKLIDFQFSACSTFAYDLCIFLKNSVQTAVRTTKLGQLLRVYHDHLKANLEFFNVIDSEIIPNLSEVEAILENLESLSFVLMVAYYPMIGDDTGASITDAFDEDSASGSVYNASMYSTEKCKRVLGQELKALIAKGLFV